MLLDRLRRFRFGLKTLLVLILGIAIGFALNLRTFEILTGLPSEAYMRSLPDYRINPPDVVQVDIFGKSPTAAPSFSGQRLVGPDGDIDLGKYGQVDVAGLTISQAQEAIESAVGQKTSVSRVDVSIIGYNSSVYYIIMHDSTKGDLVHRMPINGNETVLDGIAQLAGARKLESAKIWISRPATGGTGAEKKLPVDWKRIAKGGDTRTNYQLLPGDRLIISRMPAAASVN